jgi:hypothetical protein
MSRFTFTNDNDFDNTHVNYSFDAESIHDVFDHMKYFLRACGYEAAGDIGLFPDVTESYDESEYQKDHAFDNIPNNSWPFGESKPSTSMPKHSEHEHGWYEWNNSYSLTSASIPALTTFDLSSFTVTDLSTLTTKSWTEWSAPTMAPLTTEQIKSWSMEMPGTLGSAKVKF